MPNQFFAIAAYFDAPTINASTEEPSCDINEEIKAAIEHCLWRWKLPLAKAWYLAIFGLKHDLLICEGTYLPLRFRKT